MTSLALAVLLVAPAAAQTYRATGSVFCICPDGRRKQVHAPVTCESFCGVGDSSPGVDYGAIQRAQEAERLAREQREREAAEESARRARKAMEQREFEQKKAEALSSLKGVSTGEPTLKGVSAAPNGLKGVDSASGDVKLKGLGGPREEAVADEPLAKPKACRIVDTCADALKSQTDALDAARRDQADLYMAMGTADLQHGVDLAHEGFADKLKAMIEPKAKIRVWDGKDKAGLATYQRDYKTHVDDIYALAARKRAAALNGKYDAAKSGGLETGAETLYGAWQEHLDYTKKALDFSLYVRALSACGGVPPSDYVACIGEAGANFAEALEGLPVAEATQARVKAMGDAYTKYSTRALERAMDVSRAAAKCFQGCR